MSTKYCLNNKNGGETVINYTFRIGYTYRADCTDRVSVRGMSTKFPTTLPPL
jgi:hypothetical protein